MCNLKKKKKWNIIKTGTVASQSCVPYKDTHKDKGIVHFIARKK